MYLKDSEEYLMFTISDKSLLSSRKFLASFGLFGVSTALVLCKRATFTEWANFNSRILLVYSSTNVTAKIANNTSLNLGTK